MNNINALVLCVVLIHLGQKACGSEIINGEKASSKSFRYIASVQNNGKHVCGGFLISQDVVVTAAHCCQNCTKMSVVVGTHNLKKINESEMRYNVLKCRHPDFVNALSGRDIMLLKLSRKTGQRKRWKTAKLPNKNKVSIEAKCLVAGWGLTQTAGTVTDDLRVVDVSTIDLKVCQKQWSPYLKTPSTLPQNIICAGGYAQNYDESKGACQGDSGGPLQCNGKTVGIVSFNFNNNCDYPNLPNIYTDVSKYLPWIKKIIKGKKC